MSLAQVLPAKHLVLDEVRGKLAADDIAELVGADPGSRTLRIQVRLGEDVTGGSAARATRLRRNWPRLTISASDSIRRVLPSAS